MAGRRILVVDDNPDVREPLSELLKDWGHDVANAADGKTALTVAGQFVPEVVLLDLGLPDMQGNEVASRLRAAPGGNQLFVIALTGYALEQDMARIRESGFDAYLQKGAELDKLGSLLAGVPNPGR
jgi:two-component system CheB/CheR fusion protein